MLALTRGTKMAKRWVQSLDNLLGLWMVKTTVLKMALSTVYYLGEQKEENLGLTMVNRKVCWMAK